MEAKLASRGLLEDSRQTLSKPLELQQLEVLDKRQGLSTEAKRKLWSQRTGFQGEQDFYEFLLRYKKPHWRILHRTWLNIGGRLECDFIVITRVGIYFFEIKNYNGNLIYEYHQQSINQKSIPGDIFGQFKKMRDRTVEMCLSLNYSGKVSHQLVYINPYYIAQVPEEWSNSLLLYNQLKEYCEQMLRDEAITLPANVSPDRLVEYLATDFHCESPYPPQAISQIQFDQLHQGCECTMCGSFETVSSRYKLTCRQCHHQEPKDQAALRLIGDYAVLFPDQPLRAPHIAKLSGAALNKSYINKILKRYFKLISEEKTGQFVNPQQNFIYTTETFPKTNS